MHADCPPRMLLWEWLQPRAFPCRPGRHGFVISALSCEAGEGGAKRRVRVRLLKYPGKRKPALRRVFFKSLDPRQKHSGMTHWQRRARFARPRQGVPFSDRKSIV